MCRFDFKVILIMSGVLVTALGSEPWSSASSPGMGIVLALGSNVCFALRNVGLKYYADESSYSKTSLHGFVSISIVGCTALIPLFLLSVIIKGRKMKHSKCKIKPSLM